VCRGAEEDESEGELGQEDLEGLEVEDMERIARMGLEVDELQKKKRNNHESTSFEKDFEAKIGRRGKRKRRDVRAADQDWEKREKEKKRREGS
jgi:hypothetical protein